MDRQQVDRYETRQQAAIKNASLKVNYVSSATSITSEYNDCALHVSPAFNIIDLVFTNTTRSNNFQQISYSTWT